MKDFVLVTGNQRKADYLQKWLGQPIKHKKIDLDEIQSLDLREVTTHKAKQAYEIVGVPVLVEDVSLTIEALGKLPGTYIKWFLQELGLEGLCQLAKSFGNDEAECAITYALFDGKTMEYFEAKQRGTIASTPRGNNGFGWNTVFIPKGSILTYGEMDEETFRQWNIRSHAVKKLSDYLTKH